MSTAAAVSRGGKQWTTVGAGVVSVSAILASSYGFSDQQKRSLLIGSANSKSSDLFTPNTNQVRIFTGNEVDTEAEQLQKEILMLVARHGEQRIQRQLTRRVLAQQNAMNLLSCKLGGFWPTNT